MSPPPPALPPPSNTFHHQPAATTFHWSPAPSSLSSLSARGNGAHVANAFVSDNHGSGRRLLPVVTTAVALPTMMFVIIKSRFGTRCLPRILTQDHEVACQGTPVQSDLIMCLQLAAQIGRETRRSACFSLYTAPSVDESDGKASAAAIFFLVCSFFFWNPQTKNRWWLWRSPESDPVKKSGGVGMMWFFVSGCLRSPGAAHTAFCSSASSSSTGFICICFL